jgi:hypothetical protein
MLITRRDVALVLTKASQADCDRRGPELAAATLVEASLGSDSRPFVRVTAALAVPLAGIADCRGPGSIRLGGHHVARACAATVVDSDSVFDQLLLTLHSWQSSAAESRLDTPGKAEQEWLDVAATVANPRG